MDKNCFRGETQRSGGRWRAAALLVGADESLHHWGAKAEGLWASSWRHAVQRCGQIREYLRRITGHKPARTDEKRMSGGRLNEAPSKI